MKKITSSALSLILVISSLSPLYCLSKFSDLTKEEQWQFMAQEVDTWSDGQGLPIDAGIKRTVTILNLLGCTTRQSCEGHSDWGCPYPWVDFDTQDTTVEMLEAQRDAFGKRIDKIELGNLDNKEKLEELYQEGGELAILCSEYHELGDKIEQIQRLKLVPLRDLLTHFYTSHPINLDKMLILNPWLRLQSMGGEWQITRNESEKLKKLKEYQEEMRLFTDFLIEYWKSL